MPFGLFLLTGWFTNTTRQCQSQQITCRSYGKIFTAQWISFINLIDLSLKFNFCLTRSFRKISEVALQHIIKIFIHNGNKGQTFLSILFCLWKNSTLMSPHTGNGWGNSKYMNLSSRRVGPELEEYIFTFSWQTTNWGSA